MPLKDGFYGYPFFQQGYYSALGNNIYNIRHEKNLKHFFKGCFFLGVIICLK